MLRVLTRSGLAGILMLAALPAALAAEATGVVVEQLMQTSQSWDGAAYLRYPDGPPELTVLRITIPPKTALPWHTHPMPNAAYVVSGELLVEKRDGGATRQLVAGDVLPEAEIAKREMQYLYDDGDRMVLMDQQSFEQLEIPRSAVGS